MKFSTSVAAALVAASPLAAARQSAAFRLMAVSDDDKVNGTYFNACHEGAAIEGLCVGSSTKTGKAEYETYKLNNTKSTPDVGSLNWLLKGGNFQEYEPLTLYSDPSTNVALPLFEPGYTNLQVGFDNNDKMYIPSYIDDTVNPPKSVNDKKLYRWSTCKTYYLGYTYTTLAWTLGEKKPQNPTCEDVTVKRVFT